MDIKFEFLYNFHLLQKYSFLIIIQALTSVTTTKKNILSSQKKAMEQIWPMGYSMLTSNKD